MSISEDKNNQNDLMIKPQNTFNILSSVNLNEITKDPDNSLLKLKIINQQPRTSNLRTLTLIV